MIYETDTDLTYIYNGSSWQQVSGGTAVGNSGLVYIKSQTIGTGVSSVTVTNAFSSTYDNYKIIVSGGVGSSGGTNLQLQLDGLTSGYYGGASTANYQTGAFVGFGMNGLSQWTYAGFVNTTICLADIDVYQPFLTARKWYRATPINSGDGFGQAIGEVIHTSSITGFKIIPSSGTITGGTITVYGYRKA